MAQLKSEHNTQVAQSSTVSMIVLVAAGVMIALLFGLIITRSIIKPLKITLSQLSKVANGDDDMNLLEINQFSGEYIELAQNINDVNSSLNLLLEDTNTLVEAAIEGKLSVRVDASKHRGGYSKIIEGINNTLDAVIKPINEAVHVLSEMENGNLNVNVTGDYKGDHANIKNKLNDTVNTIKGYIGEISLVLKKNYRGRPYGRYYFGI